MRKPVYTETIRPTIPGDTPSLLVIAEATAVFKPEEIKALHEVLDDYHASNQAQGHMAVTWEDEGKVMGFAYYAPACMTDRTWYLFWIIVGPNNQRRGIGGKLLRLVEDDIRRKQGRLFLIETSSLPRYEPTRKFYFRHGFEQVATLKNYYANEDDMVVFGKNLEVSAVHSGS